MATTALPTLSEVRAFTGDYLIDAARHWSGSAARWSEAFDGLARDVAQPAGAEWRGDSADSAALRAGSDRRRVAGAADELGAAAMAARRAAEDLHAAKSKLLNTVRAAEAAGFEAGEDFSLTTVESSTATEWAAREAQMRNFGFKIRSDVLALVEADEDAAAQIDRAAQGLQSLDFGSDDHHTSDRGVIQAVDFHGVPVPEKPRYLPPVPPSEGWSQDPLMRAAQKIAYGHAWDEHRTEFPDIHNKAQFAEFIYQKMHRAITDPRGLRLGFAKDGAPVIYDPADNVLIIRDNRSDTTQAGSAFKPDLPNYAAKKAPFEVESMKREQLVDGAQAPSSSPQTKQGRAEIPRHISEYGVGESSTRGTLPGWGTHISPDEAAKADGALGILGRIMLGQSPPDPRDPERWS
jgi:hypothetical protein